MATEGTSRILFLLSQGEIASSLLQHLAVGELITLARTNSAIRADLHDFGEPHSHKSITTGVRPELQIGHHETSRWKKLKTEAPYECSSSTHTKGSDVKPCHYCSKLICGACLTRASFKNPGEKTFQNRCRSFCESCWTTGNRHQQQKFVDDCECHNDSKGKAKKKEKAVEGLFTCECTNKNNSWVCLECKHLQNKVWSSSKCFGQGCVNVLDSGAERRKICLWCDKPLPISATRENHHFYRQQVVDAMTQEAAIRQAKTEARSPEPWKLLRMSLTEHRGENERLAPNATADIPNLVRHLDTMNYAQRLGYSRSPTAEQVYNSKLGNWQYNREFLLSFRHRCDFVDIPTSVCEATVTPWRTGERTNKRLFEEQAERARHAAQEQQQGLAEPIWMAHREQLIRMRFLERRTCREIQDTMYMEHGLYFSKDSYRVALAKLEEEQEAESLLPLQGVRSVRMVEGNGEVIVGQKVMMKRAAEREGDEEGAEGEKQHQTSSTRAENGEEQEQEQEKNLADKSKKRRRESSPSAPSAEAIARGVEEQDDAEDVESLLLAIAMHESLSIPEDGAKAAEGSSTSAAAGPEPVAVPDADIRKDRERVSGSDTSDAHRWREISVPRGDSQERQAQEDVGLEEHSGDDENDDEDVLLAIAIHESLNEEPSTAAVTAATEAAASAPNPAATPQHGAISVARDIREPPPEYYE